MKNRERRGDKRKKERREIRMDGEKEKREANGKSGGEGGG